MVEVFRLRRVQRAHRSDAEIRGQLEGVRAAAVADEITPASEAIFVFFFFFDSRVADSGKQRRRTPSCCGVDLFIKAFAKRTSPKRQQRRRNSFEVHGPTRCVDSDTSHLYTPLTLEAACVDVTSLLSMLVKYEQVFRSVHQRVWQTCDER